MNICDSSHDSCIAPHNGSSPPRPEVENTNQSKRSGSMHAPQGCFFPRNVNPPARPVRAAKHLTAAQHGEPRHALANHSAAISLSRSDPTPRGSESKKAPGKRMTASQPRVDRPVLAPRGPLAPRPPGLERPGSSIKPPAPRISRRQGWQMLLSAYTRGKRHCGNLLDVRLKGLRSEVAVWRCAQMHVVC
jgi:hypothetical protein